MKQQIPLLVLKNTFQNNNKHKINEFINAEKIRLIGGTKESEDFLKEKKELNEGLFINEICTKQTAFGIANELELDLVQITDGEIPVVKLIQYDKFLYQLEKKSKQNVQHTKKLKQVVFKPGIAQNDIDHKIKHIKEFIENGHRVEVLCRFSGRQNIHKEIGHVLFDKIVGDLKNVAKKESEIKDNGNAICMYLIKQ